MATGTPDLDLDPDRFDRDLDRPPPVPYTRER